MTEEKTRVELDVPVSLVQRADIVAEQLGISRTSLLVTSLRTKLEDSTTDDEVKHRLAEAYYNDQVSF